MRMTGGSNCYYTSNWGGGGGQIGLYDKPAGEVIFIRNCNHCLTILRFYDIKLVI